MLPLPPSAPSSSSPPSLGGGLARITATSQRCQVSPARPRSSRPRWHPSRTSQHCGGADNDTERLSLGRGCGLICRAKGAAGVPALLWLRIAAEMFPGVSWDTISTGCHQRRTEKSHHPPLATCGFGEPPPLPSTLVCHHLCRAFWGATTLAVLAGVPSLCCQVQTGLAGGVAWGASPGPGGPGAGVTSDESRECGPHLPMLAYPGQHLAQTPSPKATGCCSWHPGAQLPLAACPVGSAAPAPPPATSFPTLICVPDSWLVDPSPSWLTSSRCLCSGCLRPLLAGRFCPFFQGLRLFPPSSLTRMSRPSSCASPLVPGRVHPAHLSPGWTGLPPPVLGAAPGVAPGATRMSLGALGTALGALGTTLGATTMATCKPGSPWVRWGRSWQP